jgi:hypothetical protein
MVECLSDRLLEECNDAIRLLADKYLYTELPCSRKNIEDDMKREALQDDKDSNVHDHIELEIPPTLKLQIRDYFQSYYEDCIKEKYPSSWKPNSSGGCENRYWQGSIKRVIERNRERSCTR